MSEGTGSAISREGEGEIAVLGGGCFWCLEAVFERVKGVRAVKSGYSGGHASAPTYEAVCSGTTGHAEVVRVEFDPAVVEYRDLLGIFFSIHDPTTLNRQGNDVGTQYRSAIFTVSEEQRTTAESVRDELDAGDEWEAPIVTEIVPLVSFYPAEAYHDEYFARNAGQPYCAVVITPKVAAFRRKFRHLLAG